HDAGDRALVRDRKRRIPELARALDELLGMRCTAQERKVRDAMKLRVSGQPVQCNLRSNTSLEWRWYEDRLDARVGRRPCSSINRSVLDEPHGCTDHTSPQSARRPN